MKKKLTVFIVSLMLFHSAFADTFIVTSNADSGPGTLRDAIQKAAGNGITAFDDIIFNISDISREGRTIILKSELPELTSNLLIDGSTQAGSAIGKSDAKIILSVNSVQNKSFTFFRISNASSIELYGLLFINEVFTLFTNASSVNGIHFYNSKNIIVGKAGKGNYFRGLYYAISSFLKLSDEWRTTTSSNISIQHNVFGNDEDGGPTNSYNNTWTVVNPIEYAIYFQNVVNVLFGGDKAQEGNIVYARNIFIQSHTSIDAGFCSLKNNLFGVMFDGSFVRPTGPKDIIISISGYDGNVNYEVQIINNTMVGILELEYLSEPFVIQGNKIRATGGGEISSIIDFTTRVQIHYCSKGGIIGGEDIEQRNEIFSVGPMNHHSFWRGDFLGSMRITASPKVTIKKNITRCIGPYGSTIRVGLSDEPYVQIDETHPNFVKGKATPNCKIEVFLDDDCWACDGMALLGETYSNNDSSWSFSGSFNGVVVATATNAEGSTSGYSEPLYSIEKVVVQQPTCGKPNGYIKGMQVYGSTDNFEWHKVTGGLAESDIIISKELDLENVGPGFYYFVAKLGETCRSAFTYYQLTDATPKIDVSTQSIKQPSCGQFNGNIVGIQLTGHESSKVFWVNDAGAKFQGNLFGSYASLTDLPSGKYKLIVIDTLGGCGDSTDFFELVNQAGPHLKINDIEVTNSTCRSKNGGIKGISIANSVGTPFIQWEDSTSNPVGNSFDLTGVPAGRYRLKFKDASTCDTLMTPYYTIHDIGAISIDTSDIQISPSSCIGATGSIQNISVIGGDHYEWKNSDGELVGLNRDMINLGAGKYQLFVTNAVGCQKTSPIVIVPQASFSDLKVLNASIKNATCEETNGSIAITQFSKNSASYNLQWVNSMTGEIVGNGAAITSLDEGGYLLHAKDINGCTQEIYKTEIKRIPKPVFNYGSMVVINDQCDQVMGGISKIQIAGAPGTNLDYKWVNENGQQVGNLAELKNIGAGTYRLVINSEGCVVDSKPITIKNNNQPLKDPNYSDLVIPKHTTAILENKNKEPGTYKLYRDVQGTQLIQQNNNGVFNVGPINTDTVFFIQRVFGSCQSNIVTAKIQAVDETKVFVPTAFTPNNDGRNDHLKPIVYGIFKLTHLIIMDRWGNTVFRSNNLDKGWDGFNGGVASPAGVYVWMIKGKDLRNNELNLKGSFVLIR